MQSLVRDLNAIYKATPALHEVDFEPEGFEWISDSDRQNSVISFLRRAKDPDDFVIVICNFTPVVHENYQIGVPAGGRYEVVLNTDDNRYGGSGIGEATIEAQETPAHGKPYSLALTLPPLATIILKPVS
jgi:1,4-alpha-glucan branching enzyme